MAVALAAALLARLSVAAAGIQGRMPALALVRLATGAYLPPLPLACGPEERAGLSLSRPYINSFRKM